MKIAIDARLIGNSGIGTYIENIVPMLVNRHKQHHYLLIGHESQIGLYRGISNVELLLTDISQFSLKECVAFPVEEINKCDAFYCPYINVPGGIRVPVYSTIHDVFSFISVNFDLCGNQLHPGCSAASSARIPAPPRP